MGRSCRCAACATAARPHAGGLRSTWPERTATRIPSCPPAASLAPPRRPWTAPATFISPALTSDPTAAGLTTRPAPTSTPDGLPEATTKWNARMFVEEAVSLGATLVTGARARRVLVEDGVAKGVEFVSAGKTQTALGSTVVVAAGGIGSPVLLRASGIDQAGLSLFCDPVVVVTGSLPGPGHGQELPMTAGVLLEEEGYTLTDVSVPQWLYWLIAAEVGRVDKLWSYRRAAAILVETRDDPNGWVTRRGGIRKPFTQGDRHRLAQGTQQIGRAHV